jgi:anaerobic dimethyl sulfoxide reductase subunit A
MSKAEIVNTGGCHDCGGRCIHRAHVIDGKVVRLESDSGAEPQLRSCVRGRAYRQRLTAPGRLLYPLKRTGARGEGRFERISWDEALDTVAGELKRVTGKYGPGAVFLMWASGSHGYLHSHLAVMRLLNKLGGFTTRWGNLSMGGADFASVANFGSTNTGNDRADLVNSRLVILWGWNPAVTIQGTNTMLHLSRAKEAGARFISVDPRFTDTAAALEASWIGVRPGTDAALLAAMAWVIYTENLHDQAFLDRCTLGFEDFKQYLLGITDGIAKNPAWAEAITGVPVAHIVNLARDYATLKPAALMNGWAPGRTSRGEQFHRLAGVLAAMTGNVGVHGGNAAGCGVGVSARGLGGGRLSPGDNPREKGLPVFPQVSLVPSLMKRYRVQNCKLWDALLDGKAAGYPGDYKFLYIVGSNCLNQLPNVNKARQALQRPEFIVHQEQFLTPTARFADILLPVSTHFERNDIYSDLQFGSYYLFANQAADPPGEARSDFEIACDLAQRLGVRDFKEYGEEEWLEELFRAERAMAGDSPDFARFRREGVWRAPPHPPVVAFEKEARDPAHHPFPTPSGKIEIYSPRLAALNDPALPPVPQYLEGWEGARDPLAQTYPLQLVTTHFKRRAHSVFDNVPWLKELQPQTVTVNARDAAARGINAGEMVRVFNGRGQVVLPVIVTERIMPGVADIGEGAWYAPDENGVDRGGCGNVLTRDEQTPCGALPSNSCLVQVEKFPAC